jgi:hypothetical protein
MLGRLWTSCCVVADATWSTWSSPTQPVTNRDRRLQHQCRRPAKHSKSSCSAERAAARAGTRCVADAPLATASSALLVRWACTAEQSVATWPRRCHRATDQRSGQSRAACPRLRSSHSRSICKVGGKRAAPTSRSSSANSTGKAIRAAIHCLCKRSSRGDVRVRHRNLAAAGGVVDRASNASTPAGCACGHRINLIRTSAPHSRSFCWRTTGWLPAINCSSASDDSLFAGVCGTLTNGWRMRLQADSVRSSASHTVSNPTTRL